MYELSALSRISPGWVRVSVSMVLGLATGGYSWIYKDISVNLTAIILCPVFIY